jgi:Tol biopolymer transport system component
VISVFDLKTSEVRPLSNEKWDTCYRLEWRRDGKGIVFVGTKFGEGNTIRRDQLYYLSVTDGSARRLTTDVHRNQSESLGITDTNQVMHVPFSRTSQIWVMDPGGNYKTATQLTTGSSDGRAGLVVLPDGRIAFTARTAENLGAWTTNADGTNRQQFISDPLIIEELRATPDGKYFFYASSKENRSHLYRVDADGANPKQVTSGDSYEVDSTLSPDGKWIVYDSAAASDLQVQRLWKTSIEGGAPTKVSDINCAVPNYSLTGKYISCTWADKIYVVSPDDGALLHTFTAVRTPFLNIGARFTPDEKSLAYLVLQKGATNIWVQPLNGKQPRQLTDFPKGDVYNFAYSPDGSKLFLARGFQIRDAILISGF